MAERRRKKSGGVIKERGIMRNILLIVPNEILDVDYSVNPKIIFPIEAAYLASVLMQKGFNVKGLDLNTRPSPFEKIIIKELNAFKPDIVSISPQVLTFNIRESREIYHRVCEIVKKFDPRILTIISGSYSTAFPEKAVEDTNIDYAIRGEGEEVIPALIKTISQNPDDIGNLSGIAFRKDSQTCIHGPNACVKDLDTLPLPSRDVFLMEKYFAFPEKGNIRYPEKSLRFTTIQTSRGCSARCIFCNVSFLREKGYRKRSIQNVLQEIEYLVKERNIKELHFVDENMTLDRKRAESIFDGMVKNKYPLHWLPACGIAIYTLTETLLEKMKASGCYRLTLAIESGNEKVLQEIIHKPVRLNHARKIINYAKRLDMEIIGYFVIGFPGEAKKEIMDTIKFAEENPFDYCIFSIATPQRGTPLFTLCQQHKLLAPEVVLEDIAKRAQAVIKSSEFDPLYLETIRAREWDRINFSSPGKREKICRMMGLTMEELELKRKETKKNYEKRLKKLKISL